VFLVVGAATAVIASSLVSHAASSTVTVTATVPSAIQLTPYCAQTPAWNLGTVLPGNNALSSTDSAAPSGTGVCRFDFQSSNADAQLRLGQADGVGTAMGTRGNLVDTTGGVNWSDKWMGAFSLSTTAGTAFLIQETREIWKSTDSGTTWTAQGTSTGCPVGGLTAKNDTTLFTACAGSNSVRRGTFAGTWSWSANINTGNGGSIRTIMAVPGTDILWVCSDSTPKVRYSTNANLAVPTFTTVPNENQFTAGCTDLHVVDASNVWAVDGDGNVARTTNGGPNWAKVTNTVSMQDADIYAISGTRAWTAGRYGINEGSFVYSTSDAGATAWSSVELPEAYHGGNRDISVAAVNTNEVYVVGGSGIVYQSMNGGSTWTLRPTATSNDLWDVGVFPSGAIIASGKDQSVVRSTDGINWSLRTTEFLPPHTIGPASTDVAWRSALRGR
jgi:photosystem II stability/assembly factor-like uncharacterized protein